MTGFKNYHMKYEPLIGLLSKLSGVVYIEFLSLSLSGRMITAYTAIISLSERAHRHTRTQHAWKTKDVQRKH